ncbi:MAG: beta-ketoacyl synthase N-terminal-like domain-containing protein, partial [Acidobacteriota bacterium]
SSRLSAAFGLAGPSLTVQSACASATLAVGEAFRRIRRGQVDVMVTGGADSMMSMFSVAGFTQLGALSRNPDPASASRPFDIDRDGFVLGEGAGILIFESLDHARARGARILAEVVGFGASSDAYRFTDMHPDAIGAAAAMRAALTSARVAPEAVGYINAHGTSTPQNDRMETLAIKKVFGDDHAYRLAVSSTKSQLGHLLCAAGGLEAVVTALALQRGVLPPTIHLRNPDPECDLDYVTTVGRRAEIEYALSNSFAFGGQNGSVLMRRWHA